MNRVRLLVLNAALAPLDYAAPAGIAVPPGTIAVAPLGPRRVLGIAWEPDRLPADEVAASRLRPLLGLAEAPPLPAPLRRLIEWTADYYCAPLAAVARMAVPSSSALSGGATLVEYRLVDPLPPGLRQTPQRRLAMVALTGEQGTIAELARGAGTSEAVLRGLHRAGALEAVSVDPDAPPPLPDPEHGPPDLSPEQREAAHRLRELVATGAFAPVLLDGVTGSGKTEVYCEAIAEVLRAGRQALVLLPEIALTEAFLQRFAARFGAAPVAWHSSLKQSDRRRAWRAIAHGQARVVVGARSALFLPFADLGLVVVDEAHETSFKQDDGVRYNARDVAVMRGSFERIPVVLASATPAIESFHLAGLGRYERLVLASRHAGAAMPATRIVNLVETPPERGSWLAPPLVEATQAALERGEQALLFLNRRGYAPLTLCRHCGHRFRCPQCSAWLVEHRLSARLACHHCGHAEPQPPACPECGQGDMLVACGPGVERIAEEAARRFPQARLFLATSDTLASPARAAAFVEAVAGGAVDIVIGTQLVTKGFHFPQLTLVGVVDADLGLEGGDLRAAEHSFQQIAQVAGRAGRASKPGQVLIQTRHPDAPVIAALAAGDRDAFYAAEIAARHAAGMPPFGRLATIVFSSEDEAEAREAARKAGAVRPERPGLAVLGPAPPPLALLRGRHRQRFLLHARRDFDLQGAIREWLSSLDLPRSVRIGVDIDPYSFS